MIEDPRPLVFAIAHSCGLTTSLLRLYFCQELIPAATAAEIEALEVINNDGAPNGDSLNLLRKKRLSFALVGWAFLPAGHLSAGPPMENRLHRTVGDKRFGTCYALQMFRGIADSRSPQDLSRCRPLLEFEFSKAVSIGPKDLLL
jgi:hypothetical protein